MICISVFYFDAMRKECEAQKVLVDSIRDEEALFKVVRGEVTTEYRLKGLYTGIGHRKYEPYGYVIDEAAIIRAGEFIGGL